MGGARGVKLRGIHMARTVKGSRGHVGVRSDLAARLLVAAVAMSSGTMPSRRLT